MRDPDTGETVYYRPLRRACDNPRKNFERIRTLWPKDKVFSEAPYFPLIVTSEIPIETISQEFNWKTTNKKGETIIKMKIKK